jgi:hypothetical protein
MVVANVLTFVQVSENRSVTAMIGDEPYNLQLLTLLVRFLALVLLLLISSFCLQYRA